MNRPATACLWAASILATWLIVREPPNDPIVVMPDVPRRVATLPALPRVVERDDFGAVKATLERDLADGAWSVEDRDRLNAGLLRLTKEQAAQLYEVLFPKLNDGSVKSGIDGPPI